MAASVNNNSVIIWCILIIYFQIQQLLEMLKRDQDTSSLTSGEGSNTDSGRGASEEGDIGGSRSSSLVTDGHGSGK